MGVADFLVCCFLLLVILLATRSIAFARRRARAGIGPACAGCPLAQNCAQGAPLRDCKTGSEAGPV